MSTDMSLFTQFTLVCSISTFYFTLQPCSRQHMSALRFKALPKIRTSQSLRDEAMPQCHSLHRLHRLGDEASLQPVGWKALHLRGVCGRIMGKIGKSWGKLENHGKIMGKRGKSWENVGISWDIQTWLAGKTRTK